MKDGHPRVGATKAQSQNALKPFTVAQRWAVAIIVNDNLVKSATGDRIANRHPMHLSAYSVKRAKLRHAWSDNRGTLPALDRLVRHLDAARCRSGAAFDLNILNHSPLSSMTV
jgi:hypothetical protein